MHNQGNQPKTNFVPLGIGFVLIIFVIGIFFLKQQNHKDEVGSDLTEQNFSQENEAKNFKSINVKDFFQKTNSQEKFIIFDLRIPEDFDKEHIIDSINLPGGNIDPKQIDFDKAIPYFIIDDLGPTPNELAFMKTLENAGAEDIYYLEGGFSNWKNQLYPIVNFGDPYSFVDQSKVTYIKSTELKSILSQESDIHLIDLRDKNDFIQGHLEGAINIPLSELERRRKEIPFGKSIILYDDNGVLAFQGTVKLFDMGVFNVRALSEGLAAWKKEGFPLVNN